MARRKPIYPGVYVEEVPSGVHPITGVSTSVTALVGPALRGPVNKAVRITSFSEFEQRFGGLSAKLETGYALRQFFLNGGQQAWVVRVAQNATLKQLNAGLRALPQVESINLLALPGVTSPEAIALAASHAQQHRAFLIVDAPAGTKTPAAIGAAVRSLAFEPRSQAAIYFPWIKIPDPLKKGKLRRSPPSGTIAGLFARTDAQRGVWKAPAGMEATLTGVPELDYPLTDSENGMLNPRGINALRTFPRSGPVVWGARTLAGDDGLASEYKYIPVRRLALFLEASLDRGTQWAVFEPNAEPLWAQLRLHIGTFLNTLFRQGAFQAATPRDAYFVKCDRETTTQADLDAGRVNFHIGFAPLKPAEFVILKFTQRTGSAAP